MFIKDKNDISLIASQQAIEPIEGISFRRNVIRNPDGSWIIRVKVFQDKNAQSNIKEHIQSTGKIDEERIQRIKTKDEHIDPSKLELVDQEAIEFDISSNNYQNQFNNYQGFEWGIRFYDLTYPRSQAPLMYIEGNAPTNRIRKLLHNPKLPNTKDEVEIINGNFVVKASNKTQDGEQIVKIELFKIKPDNIKDVLTQIYTTINVEELNTQYDITSKSELWNDEKSRTILEDAFRDKGQALYDKDHVNYKGTSALYWKLDVVPNGFASLENIEPPYLNDNTGWSAEDVNNWNKLVKILEGGTDLNEEETTQLVVLSKIIISDNKSAIPDNENHIGFARWIRHKIGKIESNIDAMGDRVNNTVDQYLKSKATSLELWASNTIDTLSRGEEVIDFAVQKAKLKVLLVAVRATKQTKQLMNINSLWTYGHFNSLDNELNLAIRHQAQKLYDTSEDKNLTSDQWILGVRPEGFEDTTKIEDNLPKYGLDLINIISKDKLLIWQMHSSKIWFDKSTPTTREELVQLSIQINRRGSTLIELCKDNINYLSYKEICDVIGRNSVYSSEATVDSIMTKLSTLNTKPWEDNQDNRNKISEALEFIKELKSWKEKQE